MALAAVVVVAVVVAVPVVGAQLLRDLAHPVADLLVLGARLPLPL